MDSLQNKATVNIQDLIYTFRGYQVMLDRDLAEVYQVETRHINQAVKRNIDRFPEIFRFQLSEEEFEIWKSQIVISNKEKMGLRRRPYAFTEQGIAMLSAILKSDVAVKVSIQIMQAFVKMRRALSLQLGIIQRIDKVELKIGEHDKKIEKVFEAIQLNISKPKQGIFFDGQIFDAYKFVSDLIRSAKKSIILIDNYVDDSVLTLLSKKKENIPVKIYSKNISKQLILDTERFNKQYPTLKLIDFDKSHDRFLVIDSDLYHIGASLKDLGKKWFAFSKMEKDSFVIFEKLGI